MHHPLKRSKRLRETTNSSSYVARSPSPRLEQRHRGPSHLPSNFFKFVGFIVALLVTGILYISLSKSVSRRTGTSPTLPNTTDFGIGSTRVRSPSPKVIDRTVLHVVLHGIHEPDNHYDSSPSTVSRPHLQWPPIVTRIPESNDVSELEHTGVCAPSVLIAPAASAATVQFDESVCGSFPCRFLLPLRIAEQEPKAHLHLHQLAILASSLNRTLVLPNVGNNRIGACSKWPFDSYYDVDLLSSALPAVDTLPFTVFDHWSETRPILPTSRVVSFSGSKSGEQDSLLDPLTDDFTIDYGPADHKVTSCLHSKFPRLCQSSSMISFRFHRNNLIRPPTSRRLIQILSEAVDSVEYFSDELIALQRSDVLAIEWDLRYPIFPDSTINLQYSHALVELAERLATFTGPYVAVYWRLERVPVENLAWCAASLVSTLRSVLDDDSGPRLVWFATDYHTLSEQPSGVKTKSAKSGIFQAVTPEHEEAMNILQDAFRTGGDLEGYAMTDLPSQIGKLRMFEGNVQFEEEVVEDLGISGILNKLVSMQSQVFVSGSRACSKISSSSKQIVDFRESVMRDKEIALDIRNVVELFGEW